MRNSRSRPLPEECRSDSIPPGLGNSRPSHGGLVGNARRDHDGFSQQSTSRAAPDLPEPLVTEMKRPHPKARQDGPGFRFGLHADAVAMPVEQNAGRFVLLTDALDSANDSRRKVVLDLLLLHFILLRIHEIQHYMEKFLHRSAYFQIKSHVISPRFDGQRSKPDTILFLSV